MALTPFSASVQSLSPLPTIKLGPSGADSKVVGFVYILRPCGSPQWTLLWSWEFLPLLPQSSQVFSVRGFEALFPLAGTLGCLVYLAPQLFLQVYLHTNVGLPRPQSTVSPGPPAAALSRVLSAQLPLSAPPTSLDECFFFNSLVVGLPCSLIFCQFWLVFVLEFVVVFLLVVQGSTVCLPMPPSWEVIFFLIYFEFYYLAIICIFLSHPKFYLGHSL